MFAELDGQALEEESGAGWVLRTGTAPHILTLDIDATAAARLFSQAERDKSRLILRTFGGDEQAVEGLTILSTGPSNTPYTSSLRVADIRWAWPRRWVKRSYNIRRKTGAVRRIGDEQTPRAIATVADDVAYAAWSLEDGVTAWTPEAIIKDVMDRVTPEWEDRNGVLNNIQLPDIEGLELDSEGDAAVGRVLTAMGGVLTVYVDYDGVAVLLNRADDGEREIVGAPAPEPEPLTTRTRIEATAVPLIQGPQLWAVQNRRLERPELVRVFISRVFELRADFVEKTEGAVGKTKERAKGVPVRCQNVLRIPEDAKQADGFPGRDVVAGTWVTFDDYLAFLADKPPSGTSLPAISRSLLNQGWLHAVPEAYASPALDPSGLWARRIAAIRQHYRLTYRIGEPWISRLRGIKGYRVSLDDVENNLRGPSSAFVDHAAWITWRAVGSEVDDRPPVSHIVRNRFANPIGPDESNPTRGATVGTPITDLKAAPFAVTVVDEDQGIFTLTPTLDWSGEATRYERSAITKASLPSADLREDVIWLQDGELVPDHELSVILTCTLGAPNDLRQFHTIEITPEEANALIPGDRGAEQALGPVLEVHVPESVAVARFGWDDTRAQAIYDAFSIAVGAARDSDLGNALGEAINREELEIVAQAEAARQYARFRDHIEGSLTTGFIPGLRPRGTVKQIEHAWRPGPNGGALTVVDLPPEPPEFTLEAILPRGIQRYVRRFVEP